MTNGSATEDSSALLARFRESALLPRVRDVLPIDVVLESVPLKLASVGAFFALVGAVVREGSPAAFVFIWGVAFFLIGLASHLVIRYNQPD